MALGVGKDVEVIAGIVAWYLTSFGTLLLNKYLLGKVRIQPNTLAVVQMVSTAIYGALKTVTLRDLQVLRRDISEAWKRRPRKTGTAPAEEASGNDLEGACNSEDPDNPLRKPDRWRRGLLQISFVGVMRFATVILGLVSLQHVAASFTETIKASAPFFTVVIAFLMLGERTSLNVVMTLVPLAGGLVLVSFSEVSFNVIGFAAAISTNVIECVQNVFSKSLLAQEYTASQLQFYTSLTALVLQVPIFLLSSSDAATLAPAAASSIDGELLPNPWQSPHLMALLWVDGVLYHLQSVVAYVVMSHLSPVTVSVINTLKRALLIWISVLVFGNRVTGMAKVGTGICLLGALWYNYMRQQPTLNASRSASHDPPHKS